MISKIIHYLFVEHFDFTVPTLLALFSIWLACYFWRNPISTDFKPAHLITDTESKIKYEVGHDYKGWKIRRTNYDINGNLITSIKSSASIENNPHIKIAPQTLQEIKLLKFD